MNILKNIKNKDRNKYKYTILFEKNQQEKAKEKERQNKEIKKNRKSTNIIFSLITLILLSSIIMIIYENYRKTELSENGIKTRALITNITHKNYRMNDMDGTFVNNYQIEYQFTYNQKIINSFYEIRIENYNKYFSERMNPNDSINIRYNPKNPNENEIVMKKLR